MATVVYNGPGDAVELDGLRLERGKKYEVTNGQLARIRASDPLAAVEGQTAFESPHTEARILATQSADREKIGADRRKAELEEQREVLRLEDEARARDQRSAEAAEAAEQKLRKERETARAGSAKKLGGKD